VIEVHWKPPILFRLPTGTRRFGERQKVLTWSDPAHADDVVEKVELGLKPGDVVFEFPYGRIVDNGMACRQEQIIPPDVEITTIHKEAIAARGTNSSKPLPSSGESGTNRLLR
jgi:hypothetical protein